MKIACKSFISLCCAVGITSCATTPSTTPVPVEDAGSQAPIERVTTKPSTVPQSSSAAHTLLAQANASAANSEHQTAIVYLERAIRLEPRNASLWTTLAQQYLATNNTAKATQYVRKAIALAGADLGLSREAWLTLADIKEEEGAVYEAQSIRQKYASLSG